MGSRSRQSKNPLSPPLLSLWPVWLTEGLFSSLQWVMQVDGAEEELPGELENACSDAGQELFL